MVLNFCYIKNTPASFLYKITLLIQNIVSNTNDRFQSKIQKQMLVTST